MKRSRPIVAAAAVAMFRACCFSCSNAYSLIFWPGLSLDGVVREKTGPQKSVVLKMMVAPVKAVIREGTEERSAETISTPREERVRARALVGVRVRPRTR